MAGVTVTPQSWAQSLLAGLGAPQTPANVQAVVGWENAEGGHWANSATYNPLNTTQVPTSGSYSNTGSQGNIKAYSSWSQGLQATIATLRNGNYPGILAALKAGNNPAAVGSAIGASPWGTSGSRVSQAIAAAAGSAAGAASSSTDAISAALIPGGTASSPTSPTASTAGPATDLFGTTHSSQLLYATVWLGILLAGFMLLGLGVNRSTHGAPVRAAHKAKLAAAIA